MSAMKQDFAKTTKAPLIPIDQSHYNADGQIKNNPLSERGTVRWLKKQKRAG